VARPKGRQARLAMAASTNLFSILFLLMKPGSF
jgi:hypothetical protein